MNTMNKAAARRARAFLKHTEAVHARIDRVVADLDGIPVDTAEVAAHLAIRHGLAEALSPALDPFTTTLAEHLYTGGDFTIGGDLAEVRATLRENQP